MLFSFDHKKSSLEFFSLLFRETMPRCCQCSPSSPNSMSGSGVNGSSFLPPDDNSNGRPAGLAYGLPASVGILMVITAALLASYLCTRARTTAANRRSGDVAATPTDLEAGIDEATLTSYPKVTYSQAKLEEKGTTTAACCSICLSDYEDADVLRLLPDCGHLFHLDCVDPWLRAHRSCPNCRSSPAPSSMPTPLSEVVPLARARQSQ